MNYIDKKKIADTISKHFSNIDPSEIESYLEIPPSEIDFNYALPCYRLAKTEKKPPNIIANELKEKLNDIDYLENIQVSEGGISK
jgi:arginyl-tRNA synthetase